MGKRREDKAASSSSTTGLAKALASVRQEIQLLLANQNLMMPENLSLPIDLKACTPQEWVGKADRILESVQKVALHNQGRTSGQGLWCFQCRTFGCHHGTPSSRSHIFSGYSATGKPMWEAFIDACIRLKPPGMDALFGDSPVPLAMVLTADDLNEERLEEFVGRKETLEFCGQVVAGLLPSTLWTSKGVEERAVLSIQLLRRPVNHGYEYQMNLLGFTDREIIEAAVAGGSRSRAELINIVIQRTHRRLRGARGEIATLSGSTQGRHEAFVDRVLSQLRGDIDQICRSGSLRTKHAEKRHKAGERPTGNALADARNAGREQVLFDTRHETFVVLGRNHRAHVFSPQGRHVTSLRLQRGEIDRKVQRKRWRMSTRGEYDAFGKIMNQGGQGVRSSQNRSSKGRRRTSR